MEYQSPPLEQDVVEAARWAGCALFRIIARSRVDGQYGRLTHYADRDAGAALGRAVEMAKGYASQDALIERIDTATGQVVGAAFRPTEDGDGS